MGGEGRSEGWLDVKLPPGGRIRLEGRWRQERRGWRGKEGRGGRTEEEREGEGYDHVVLTLSCSRPGITACVYTSAPKEG